MTITDIKALITSGESKTLELKKSTGELLEIMKHRIAELHNWHEKTTTTVMIGKLIHEIPYAELPESYGNRGN